MYSFIKSSLIVCLLACASLAVSFPAFAHQDDPHSTYTSDYNRLGCDRGQVK